jgi:hypothetical protein
MPEVKLSSVRFFGVLKVLNPVKRIWEMTGDGLRLSGVLTEREWFIRFYDAQHSHLSSL